jgi:glycosyltransferase involved in cell wall biosynthesis
VSIRRVLVCNAQVPFTTGGAEAHAAGLVAALRVEGYEADLTALPFNWHPASAIVRSTSAWRLLDVESCNGRDIDLVVPLKFPAWAVQHPCKVAWVLHQHRSAYNLAGTPYDDLSGYPDGADVRAFVERSDSRFLGECRAVFANSDVVADRLRRHSGIESETLLHPPPLAASFGPPGEAEHVLCVGRVEVAKRPDLLLEAMASVRADVQLVFAGAVADEPRWREQIERLGVADRVQILGHVDDATLLALYRDALAVAYVPVDEDLGYVTLEAMAAGKPVVVTDDAGAAPSFVVDGTTGRVVVPDPVAIASAIDELAADRRRSRRMGAAGRDAYDALGLSWSTVVGRLVDAAS